MFFDKNKFASKIQVVLLIHQQLYPPFILWQRSLILIISEANQTRNILLDDYDDDIL